MWSSFQVVFRLAFVVCCLALLRLCIFKTNIPSTLLWEIRGGLAVMALGSLFGCVWRPRRGPETLVDHLAQITPGYFERDGLCFAFAPAFEENGRCVMNVFFQNRYSGASQARLLLTPPKSFLGKRVVEPVDVAFPCEGGAFGVLRMYWDVPDHAEGTEVKFSVKADVGYPEGRGRELRFREGVQASSTGVGFAILIGILFGAVGTMVIISPSFLKMRLPRSDGKIRGGSQAGKNLPSLETLWRPDLPTGGFAVKSAEVPMAAIAA